MSTAVAVVLFLAVTTYAVFGGADFGAGFWDLVAGGATAGRRPREVIDHSIGPVWEANHVWLIFIFVVLWTGFSEAYASITLTLFVPLDARRLRDRAARVELRVPQDRLPHPRPPQLRRRLRPSLGPRPVLHGRRRRRHRLGSGARRAASPATPWDSWVNPTSVLGGVLAVVVVAYLAAVYLVWDARRLGDADHGRVLPPPGHRRRRRRRRRRARRHLRPARRRPLRLRRAHLPGPARSSSSPPSAAPPRSSCSLRDAARGARVLAIGAVASVVVGWGVAQWPYILPTSLEVSDAAAPSGTLATLVVATVLLARDRRPRLHPAVRPRPEEPAAGRGRRLTRAATTNLLLMPCVKLREGAGGHSPILGQVCGEQLLLLLVLGEEEPHEDGTDGDGDEPGGVRPVGAVQE